MTAKQYKLCADCGCTINHPNYGIELRGPETRRVLAVLCDPCATNAVFPYEDLHESISNTLKGTS